MEYEELAKSKSRKGKQARARGLQFERDVAIKLRRFFPKAKRHLEFQKEEAKGFDLDNTGNFYFQLKKKQHYASISCIEEVKTDNPLSIPALITAGDRSRPVVCFYLDDFLTMMDAGKLHELF